MDVDFEGKSVLGVFSHLDDEAVCGWPIFQNKKIDRDLIIVADDYDRKGQGRIDGFDLFPIK